MQKALWECKQRACVRCTHKTTRSTGCLRGKGGAGQEAPPLSAKGSALYLQGNREPVMGQAQTKARLGLVNSQLRRKMTFALRTAEGLQGSGYWRSVAGDKVFCWPGRWNTLPQPGGHPGPHLPQQPGKLSRGQESLGSLVFLPPCLSPCRKCTSSWLCAATWWPKQDRCPCS